MGSPVPEQGQFEQVLEQSRALAAMRGQGRAVLLESLLSRLIRIDPTAGELVGNFLTATEHISGDNLLALGRVVASQSRGREGLRTQQRAAVDLLIVAPKIVEEDAVLAAFGVTRGKLVRTKRLKQIGYLGVVDGRTVLVCSPKHDGNTGMALYVSEWLHEWAPSVAALIGMAGGRANEVKPGDLVLGEVIFDYQHGRLIATPDGNSKIENRFLSFPVAGDLIRDIPGLDRDDWAASMKSACVDAMNSLSLPRSKRPKATTMKAWTPTVKSGGILAGSTLIEDGSIEKLTKSVHDRAVAIEMEGAGFAAAMQEWKVPWISIRGIADMGGHPDYMDENGKTRTKEWQFPSTFAAAYLLRSAISVINVFAE
ncbi:MAG: kinesin light chain-like protein [Glaciihabitans sp.]|nr:kinesin light chain-like protein [Glaciihabitans sp.]